MSTPTVAEIRAVYEGHRAAYSEIEAELFSYIARFGDERFRELLDRFQARQALCETALVNYVTAIILAENVADARVQAENRARIEALERRAYGTSSAPGTPPPGVPDEESYTGR